VERRETAIGSPPLAWQFGRQHVDLLNDRRAREQLGRLLHQRGCDLPRQVRLAALIVREGVVDAETGRTETEGVPGQGGRLPLDDGEGALEKFGDRGLLAGLGLEADIETDANPGGGGGRGHVRLSREGCGHGGRAGKLISRSAGAAGQATMRGVEQE